MDWAAETSVQLDYNNKIERMMPLLDLLMAPQTFDEVAYPGAQTGLWIRENLTFEVRILMQPKATQALQDFLISHTRGHRLICWIYLEGQLRKDVQ